ncbi:hypothetical protein [Psychromonas hadalis]|uniref:hypothetical protein n=1 Tax=Psychromonas hadalis TaxID=211669 RepID=UPI0012EB7F82|nr:hypothetical protein [Psychromonas hadalis]
MQIRKWLGQPFFWFRFLWLFKENELAKGEITHTQNTKALYKEEEKGKISPYLSFFMLLK